MSQMSSLAGEGTYLASGFDTPVSQFGWLQPCRVCGSRDETFTSGGNSVSVYHGTVPNREHYNYCLKCTHWNPETRTFQSPEYWIRRSVPFSSGTPDGIISDWLEEHGKMEAAIYLRSLRGGTE